MTRVTVLYATPVAIPPVQAALATLVAAAPDTQILTCLDEGLLRIVLDDGGLTDRARDRMSVHLRLAAEAHSDALLVTCNIYSPVLEGLRGTVAPLPVLAVDEPMVRRALEHDRIAVVGTGRSGLESVLEMLRAEADRRGREVRLTPYLVEDAFGALTSGAAQRHDELVRRTIARLGDEVEVVVLAQASMARVVEDGPRLTPGPPVLSSPALAVAELGRLIGVPLTG
jgi:hypothetical protein